MNLALLQLMVVILLLSLLVLLLPPLLLLLCLLWVRWQRCLEAHWCSCSCV